MVTLEERIQALEERECYDDTDIKEKMGYDLVPENSNIQAEIDALKNQNNPSSDGSFFEGTLKIITNEGFEGDVIELNPYIMWSENSYYKINNEEPIPLFNYETEEGAFIEIEFESGENILEISNNWNQFVHIINSISGGLGYMKSPNVTENISIELPYGKKYILPYEFGSEWDSFSQFILPETIEYIGFSCFSYFAKDETITFPDSVRYIGSYNFSSGCSELIFPESLEIICDPCFDFSNSPIESITFKNPTPPVFLSEYPLAANSIFTGYKSSDFVINVPEGAESAYQDIIETINTKLTEYITQGEPEP